MRTSTGRKSKGKEAWRKAWLAIDAALPSPTERKAMKMIPKSRLRALREKWVRRYVDSDQPIRDCIDDLTALLDEAQEMGEPWVSVKDRLPPKERYGYLLYCAGTEIEYVGYRIAERFYIGGLTNGEHTPVPWSDVTHWMSLPEPPNPTAAADMALQKKGENHG